MIITPKVSQNSAFFLPFSFKKSDRLKTNKPLNKLQCNNDFTERNILTKALYLNIQKNVQFHKFLYSSSLNPQNFTIILPKRNTSDI